MENNNYFERFNAPAATTDVTRTFVAQVFTYMTAALAITGAVAYWFGTTDELFGLLYNIVETPNGLRERPTIMGWVVIFAPLLFVFLMGGMVNKLSATAMMLAFVVFAVLMGMSMSSIFRVYTQASIASTFFITSGTFGFMAFIGYTTKTDLTKLGSILMMGLVGIILATVVNLFIGSSGLHFIISILGVLIFTGLIAYDTQKIKNFAQQIEPGTAMASKMAILGALSLYLDFINLFTFLLHLLGGRNNE